MFKKIITLATVTIGLGIPLIVNAAPIVYTGADDAVTSLADMTNSSAAAAAFDAAVPGASVIDFESPVPGGVTIKQAALRGVDSSGMLCSEKELALADDASGLMILDPSLVPGTLMAAVLNRASPVPRGFLRNALESLLLFISTRRPILKRFLECKLTKWKDIGL